MLAATGKNGRVYGIDRASHYEMFNTLATTMMNDQAPTPLHWLKVCPGVQGGAMFVAPPMTRKRPTCFIPGRMIIAPGTSGVCLSDAGVFGKGGRRRQRLGGGGKGLEAPRGWITAIDGRTGAVRWKYDAEAQAQAGMVPTNSGLLFAGDTHGHLLIFDAANGALIKSIDAGGALNSGVISYSVGGVNTSPPLSAARPGTRARSPGRCGWRSTASSPTASPTW